MKSVSELPALPAAIATAASPTMKTIAVTALSLVFGFACLAAPTPMDTFKDWISGRIPIREAYVLKMHNFEFTNGVFEVFRFGRSGRAYFYQDCTYQGTNLPAPLQSIRGYDGEILWRVTKSVQVTHDAGEFNDPGWDLDSLRITRYLDTIRIRSATLGGLYGIDLKTLKWQDDFHFTADTLPIEPRESVQQVSGVVTSTTNDAPAHIEMFWDGKATSAWFRYGPQHGPGIPIELIYTTRLHGKAKVSILKLEIGAEPAKDQFLPSGYASPGMSVAVHTNGAVLALSENGKLTPSIGPKPKIQTKSRTWLLPALIIFGVIPLFVALRAKAKKIT